MRGAEAAKGRVAADPLRAEPAHGIRQAADRSGMLPVRKDFDIGQARSIHVLAQQSFATELCQPGVRVGMNGGCGQWICAPRAMNRSS